MNWTDIFPGFWNGLTAWTVLMVHVFGGWSEFPIYDFARIGNWYAFGFLVGAGSPLLGAAGAGGRSRQAAVVQPEGATRLIQECRSEAWSHAAIPRQPGVQRCRQTIESGEVTV